MNAAQKLGELGVPISVAQNFLISNLARPKVIYDLLLSAKVSSSNVAEILAPIVPGVSSVVVESFFSARGYAGGVLGTFDTVAAPSGFAPTVAQLKTNPLSIYANNITLNSQGGALSNAAIKASIIAGEKTTFRNPLTIEKYNAFFNPNQIDTNKNGQIDASEVGKTAGTFSSIAATQSNFESLFYGTLLAASVNISATENDAIGAYIIAHQREPLAQWQQGFIDLKFAAMATPANEVETIDKLESLKFGVLNAANSPESSGGLVGLASLPYLFL